MNFGVPKCAVERGVTIGAIVSGQLVGLHAPMLSLIGYTSAAICSLGVARRWVSAPEVQPIVAHSIDGHSRFGLGRRCERSFGNAWPTEPSIRGASSCGLHGQRYIVQAQHGTGSSLPQSSHWCMSEFGAVWRSEHSAEHNSDRNERNSLTVVLPPRL